MALRSTVVQEFWLWDMPWLSPWSQASTTLENLKVEGVDLESVGHPHLLQFLSMAPSGVDWETLVTLAMVIVACAERQVVVNEQHVDAMVERLHSPEAAWFSCASTSTPPATSLLHHHGSATFDALFIPATCQDLQQ